MRLILQIVCLPWWGVARERKGKGRKTRATWRPLQSRLRTRAFYIQPCFSDASRIDA